MGINEYIKIGNRMKTIRCQKGISLQDMADKLGLAKSTYANYEADRREPPLTVIRNFCDIMDIGLDVLMASTRDNNEKHPISIDLKKFNNIFPIEKKRIPMLGEIACGEPIFANEDRESYVLSGTDIDADFCLKAHGDSMTGARINDGDIVFIKEQPVVENGEIAAIIIDDEATLKRVYLDKEKNRLILQAENPKYYPLSFEGEELEHIRILGKAVAFQSDII